MASSSDTILCVSCALHPSTAKPKPGIVNCVGCQKMFCLHHIGEHRQELANELETIIYQRNTTQEALETTSVDLNTELALIDTWIKETIDLVYKTAEKARQRVEDLAKIAVGDLKARCQELTSQIEICQESENYFERDLANLRTSFDQLITAKNQSNIKIVFSDIGDALDKAIQVNLDAYARNSGQPMSFIEKVLFSTKPYREVLVQKSVFSGVTVTDAGGILINEIAEFLLVEPDGSMRSLSRRHQHVENICWSNHLGLCFYSVFHSRKEPGILFSFDPFGSNLGLEEVVTPKTERDIKRLATFEKSLFIVFGSRNSTPTIEEWLLQGKRWYQSTTPKNRWRSPVSCSSNENIENIVVNRDHIALVISTNRNPHSYRFELRDRKMIVQGQIPLNLACFSEKNFPIIRLQSVPDGWLITYISGSHKPTKFVLITNDLNIYERSYLNNLQLTDLIMVDRGWNKNKLLVAYHITYIEKISNYQTKFLFYKIE